MVRSFIIGSAFLDAIPVWVKTLSLPTRRNNFSPTEKRKKFPAARRYSFKKECRVGTTHCQLGKAHGIWLGGGGKRYSQSRLHPEAIARYPRARKPPTYIGAWFSREWETLKLTTTRLLIFQLATARVLCSLFFLHSEYFCYPRFFSLQVTVNYPELFEICHEEER